MVKLFTNFEYYTEVADVAKLYFVQTELTDNADNADIIVIERKTDDGYEYKSSYLDISDCKTVVIENSTNSLQEVRLRKRYAKVSLYRTLAAACKQQMPWGSLTGIRPTKLACQLAKEGLNWQSAFTELLGVSQQKTKLVSDILDVQGDLRNPQNGCADLYIGIPFCISRCSYCSFTSGEIERLKKYVDPYVSALCNDIDATLDFASKNNITIKNVYFGGGTPTSLSSEQLARILSRITFRPREYTIEAGRPDTITEDKLKLFQKHGVDRISINPQTFNQSVLDLIGRKHSVQDIYDKFIMARKYGFIINMDLIAGLPSETVEMFENSVNRAVELSPDNITVHTLALKRGSILKEHNYSADAHGVASMVEYSHKKLYESGYLPYYMYRQKYMTENLENVGFCSAGTPCLYNIGIMEESTNILACGTNAISKRIFSDEDRIERAANAKDVITYIERYQDYLDKKFELFLR